MMVNLTLDELRAAVSCIGHAIYEDRGDDEDKALLEKLQAIIDELDPPLRDTGALTCNCRCVSVIVDEDK